MDTDKLIFVGIVTSYGEAKSTVRVTRFDKDNKVSAELPVIMPQVGVNKFWSMPQIGDPVLCVMLPNAGSKNVNDGYVIGGFFNEKDLPPVDDDNESVALRMKNGSFIKFDSEGNIELHAQKDLKITVGGKVKVDKS